MAEHAVLSPSASGRWLQCPASVRMSRGIPDEESVYAREGTQFHTLAEIYARYHLLGGSELDYLDGVFQWTEETEEEWREEQMRYVSSWLLFLRGVLEEDPDATVLLEQQVDTGVPGCWGTADVVVISPRYRWIKVIDIKYGAGVRVSAVDNSQLLLYGAGALGLVDDPLTIDEITVSIWQPRMNNFSEHTVTRRELVKWRDSLIPTAKLALGEDAPFGPSEDACRWCPVAGECSARAKFMLANDFGSPDLMNGEEMAAAVELIPGLKQWAAAVEDAALKRAYENAGSVPGFKVVRSGGRRKIMDGDKAVEVLLAAGYKREDVVVTSPTTLGKLDALVGGGEELQEILGDLLVKGEGRLSLAKDSDPRPPADAVHSAQTDFADIEE